MWPRPRSDAPDGFALLAAMFVLLVIGGLMVDATLRARIERGIALNIVRDQQARTAARAGVAHGLSRLQSLERRTRDGLEPSATADAWNRVERLVRDLRDIPLTGGALYTVEIRDVASRLPLNIAGADELGRLFVALGADFRSADVASQSILDWRDPDESHRPRGAEWEDYYRVFAPSIRPRNGPFASVRELLEVRGVTPSLYDRVADHLTVYGPGRVNLNTAPRPVLRALPGMSAEAVDVIITRRRAGNPLRNALELEAELSGRARDALQEDFVGFSARAEFGARVFEIIATGWVAGEPGRRVVRAFAVRSGGRLQLTREVVE